MLKVGIIGCGMIAQKRHAPEYAQRDDVRICAFYDAAPERAEQLAARYGGKAYQDWKELIDEAGLDAVSVCSPNRTHAEISIYALNKGLHVLCEKPMATTLKECEDMVAAAKQSGKLLFIGQNQRFAKTHIRAKSLIEGGEIGRVLRFETSFGHAGPEGWTQDANTWFFNKNMAAFGAVFDLGIHKLDLLYFLTGDPYAQVCAMLGTLAKADQDGAPISVDDNAAVLLRTQSGAIGYLSASWTNQGAEDNATRIYGTKGVLHIFEQKRKPLFIESGKKTRIYKDADAIQTNENQFDTGVIGAFVDDILRGGPASASGEDVLVAMKAVFGAVESAGSGKAVDIR